MSKPKIIVFTTAFDPFIGGAETAVKEIVKRLNDRFDFCIITHRMTRQVLKVDHFGNIPIYRLGFGTKFDRLFLFPFLAFWKGLTVSVKTSEPTILWGIMVSYASIGAFLVKLIRPALPFILTIQEGDSESHLRFSKLGATGLWWWLMLKRVTVATAISTYLKAYIRHRGYQGKVFIIPNGVDIEKFAHRTAQSTQDAGKIIITTSRLVHKNAVDVLIKAIAEVKKTIPDVQCLIAGDGPERKALEQLVSRNDLQGTIKFLGSVRHENLPELLHQATLFVRPSRSEGLGVSFIEALAAGLPIIGTPVGGIPDIIIDKKTGLFAQPDNPADLAEKIKLLLHDKELAHAMRESGHQLVAEKFSWDSIAELYEPVFKGTKKKLKLTIATPLFPPTIGGPALYAHKLSEGLRSVGATVSVVSFDAFLRFPSGIRHVLYGVSLVPKIFSCDVVLCLDTFGVGVPALVLSRLFRKPLVLRFEGDFLWEHFVERTRQDITLKNFYTSLPKLNFKERIIFSMTKWVIANATCVAFSSQWRKDIASLFVTRGTVLIANVYPFKAETIQENRKQIVVWAGRFLYLKNLYRLIQAFEKVQTDSFELHLVGSGPELASLTRFVRENKYTNVKFIDSVSYTELQKKIRESAFFVLPSLSDVAPNVIAQSCMAKTPFIMTQESGYAESLGKYGLLVDPLDENDLVEKIGLLMDKTKRAEFQKKLDAFGGREWETVVGEWKKILTSVSYKSF